jgi:ankyrin repeat protein
MRIASLTQESTQVKASARTAIANELWRAARSGHLPRVQRLLKLGADVSYRCNEHGTTALHQAVGNSHKDVVEALLEADASVDDEDHEGKTALHYATTADVVDALIMAGADVDHENREGRTPGRLALDRQNMDAVEAFISGRTDPSKIYESGEITNSSRRVESGKQSQDRNIDLQGDHVQEVPSPSAKRKQDPCGQMPTFAALLASVGQPRTAGDNDCNSLATTGIQTTESPTLSIGGSDQEHKLVIGIVSAVRAYVYNGHSRYTLGTRIYRQSSSFLCRGMR